MFAITADQVGSSRDRLDRVERALHTVTEIGGDRLAYPPERTAGDELQLITDDAQTALDIVLALARARGWSVGIGIGDFGFPDAEPGFPVPEGVRSGGGAALERAREAVEMAKKRSPRVAVLADLERAPYAAVFQAMLDLLLNLRERRSDEGWEVFDLIESGLSQADAAARLDITPQAASKRALAAGLKIDSAARPALVTLLASADNSHNSHNSHNSERKSP